MPKPTIISIDNNFYDNRGYPSEVEQTSSNFKRTQTSDH